MSYLAITRESLSGQRWHPFASLDFARGWGVLGLTASELPRAACTLPVGLLAQPDGTLLPVALCGVDPAVNHFIARDGTWLGGYLPARLRLAPFALGEGSMGERVLCVDEAAITAEGDAAGDAGQPFYADGGELTPAMAQVRDFLAQQWADEQATTQATAALAAAQLLQPWDVAITTQAGIRRLEGLQCVNEAALNQAPPAQLAALRDSGALRLAYCQLISMQHLDKLAQLADAHARLDAAPQSFGTDGTLNWDFLSQGGTMNFGNF